MTVAVSRLELRYASTFILLALVWALSVRAQSTSGEIDDQSEGGDVTALSVTRGTNGASAAQLQSRQRRCRGSLGTWCQDYHQQVPVPVLPIPRGSRQCPGGCNGVGNCNADTGLCDCPAGWRGVTCHMRDLRPCTKETRYTGTKAVGFIDADGRDLNLTEPGFMESRCGGICDAEFASCFCDGKYRRIPAPRGSPAGTPPQQRGRPLASHMCQPSDDGKGFKIPWGQVPWQDLYGPTGWCQADTPKFECHCMYEGYEGALCDEVVDTTCVNQCSGRGACKLGFCKCDEGWYGTDCARPRMGISVESEFNASSACPWLRDLIVPHMDDEVRRLATLTRVAEGGPRQAAVASAFAGSVQRKRPLIYVYDLPAAYNARMLQYRVEKHLCTWRYFGHGNSTVLTGDTYSHEMLLHEMLAQSPHRTFDPEVADFFYVPVYITCLIYPIHGWADGPHWHAPGGPRTSHAALAMLDAKRWLQRTFPWWDRRGGRDHIWLMAHDEGACYAPTEIYNASILLSSWGRLDLNHTSNTAFGPDNYGWEHKDSEYQPQGWLHLIRGHPCFTPGKDMVVPAIKLPNHYMQSPLAGAPQPERDILLLLRGDVGTHREPNYSRGIRQRLHKLAKQQDWASRHKILIGTSREVPGDYSNLLARSKFALVVPGDGWSARAEDAMLHGCVPVVIMDDVLAVWEPVLDWASFSIRIAERDAGRLPEVLLAVPPRLLQKMQRRVRQVWHRFAYLSHPLLRADLKRVREEHRHAAAEVSKAVEAGGGAQRSARRLPAPLVGDDDAFDTLLAWLHSRIAATR